jgi:hypothetical protein
MNQDTVEGNAKVQRVTLIEHKRGHANANT